MTCDKTNILDLLRLPDLISILNALFGLTAMLMVLSGWGVLHASVLILMAAVMDGLDGVIARKIEYGEFGVQLDSFADLISFGCAPAVIAYVSNPTYSYIAPALAGSYVICGMLRLARFNVMNVRRGVEGFEGLPITAGGVCMASVLIMQTFNPGLYWLTLIMLAVLSVLMISSLPYPKIGNKAVLLPAGIIFLLVIAAYYAGVFYAGVQAYMELPSIVLFILTITYLVSPVMALIKKNEIVDMLS